MAEDAVINSVQVATLVFTLVACVALLLQMIMFAQADMFNWSEHARIKKTISEESLRQRARQAVLESALVRILDEIMGQSQQMAARHTALQTVVLEISRNQRETEMLRWSDHRWVPSPTVNN